VLLTAQSQHLQRGRAALVHAAREVIQLFDLPAGGLGDPACGPPQDLVVASELGHRLADPDELVRRAEVPAEERDDRLLVPVEDREALARPPHREDPLCVLTSFDRAAVGQQAALAERAGVADGVDLEEVLVLAAEAHHPRREPHRVGDPRITRLRVDLQQFACEIPDRAVGVIGVHDHLHDVPDRTLDQHHEIPRRRRHGSQPQLLDDWARRACPFRTLAVPQEPPRAQPTIDLHPQLRQITALARRGQPYVPLDVTVTIGRGGHDLPQDVWREVAHDLPEISPLTTAFARHSAILAPQAPTPNPTFHDFASQWFDGHRHEVAPRTVEDYQWSLSRHLLPHFKNHRLSQITIAEVDRYRTLKVREREQDKEGRSLSNRSINSTLNLLAQVLETAVEYGHIQFNPARGRRRRLKAAQPKRTWLEPEQIKPLLDATVRGLRGERTMPDPRMRTLFATGICAGLRIGELLSLRWQDVNLAQGRLTVVASKTEAGTGREIDLWPELREEMTTYKAGARHTQPADYVFATATGRADTRSNIAKRLKRAVERANNTIAGQDTPAIPVELSPHSLRRTFASLLYLRGENPVSSCTRWDTPTPSSHSASTPRSWASNAAAAPAHDSPACSTAPHGHRSRRPRPPMRAR